MVKIGTVGFDLVAYTGGLTKSLRGAQRQVEGFGNAVRRSIGGAFGGLQRILSSTTAQLMGLGGALTAGGLVAQSMRLAVALEDAETAFTTFLGNGAQAKALLADLKKFSDVTPFTASQIRTAGRGLLAFGFSAEQIIPTLQYLGDAAAGSQQDINDLVNVLGKIRSKGKLQLEELNRFTERGIVLIPELAKQLGVTDKEVYKFITAGKVGFRQVEAALRALNSEGGIFADAMENLSKTTSGRLSTLKSAFDDVLAGVGTALIKGLNIKGLTERLTEMVVKYRDAAVLAVAKGVDLMVSGASYAASQVSAVVDVVGDLGEMLSWVARQWKIAQAGAMEFATASVLAISNATANLRELGNWIDYTGIKYAEKFSVWFDEAVMKKLLSPESFAEWQARRQEQIEMTALRPYDKFNAQAMHKFTETFAAMSIPELEQAYMRAFSVDIGKPDRKTEQSNVEGWAKQFLGAMTGGELFDDLLDVTEKASKVQTEALERGSQNAFSTILGTQQPVEYKSLEELKAQTGILRSMERKSILLKSASLIGGIM